MQKLSEEERDCFICRKHRGEIAVAGGAIYEDDLVYAGHVYNPDQPVYLGYIMAELKRHAPGLAEQTDEEAQELGLLVARLSRALKQSEQAEHIYALVIGHGIPHLHVHLVPRYPGTPREYGGVTGEKTVADWPKAPRGGEAEIASLCERLRNVLGRRY